MTDYPLCENMGLTICKDNPGPPGIDHYEIMQMLSPDQFKRWCDWSLGSTSAENGVYPWDMEDFLEGKPNLD